MAAPLAAQQGERAMSNVPSAPFNSADRRSSLPVPLAPAQVPATSEQSPPPALARQSAIDVRPIQPEESEAPLPLSPPGQREHAPDELGGRGPIGNALTTVVGSLAIVIGAFFIFVWMTRKTGPKGSTLLPEEVVEVLGRAPFSGRQQLQLIRVGSKLVLVAVTTGEARTLTEITHPEEVERLAGLCHQQRQGSITGSFRQMLGQAVTPRPRSPSPPAGLRRTNSMPGDVAQRSARGGAP